jgi:hypothetical protein
MTILYIEYIFSRDIYAHQNKLLLIFSTYSSPNTGGGQICSSVAVPVLGKHSVDLLITEESRNSHTKSTSQAK